MFEAGGERHSAFILTLVAGDITRDLLRADTYEDGMARLSQSFDLFCNVWRISTKGNFAAAFRAYNALSPDCLKLVMAFIRTHIDTAWGRCLFTTKKHGIIGLCPRETRLNDLLVILDGGKTPYVLRRTRGGRYRFIGECYAHELMEGQAENLDAAKNIQDFELV